MGRAQFASTDFLETARAIAAEHGPAAVTVGSVTAKLGAPVGSFYHRFSSRDLLLGALWLDCVLAFQDGFVAAIEAGDGLAAALHTSVWARTHLDDARLLLLYKRQDFVGGDWPQALRKGVAEQARRIEPCFEKFAQDALGRSGKAELQVAQYLLTGAPLAAVRPHLERRQAPPPLVDELIRLTYESVVQKYRAGRAGSRGLGTAR